MIRLVLAGLLTLACSTPSPTPSPTASPSPSPAPTPTPSTAATVIARGLPALGEELSPGTYFASVSSAYITFEVGPGWVHQQSATDFFDIEQDPGSPDVIAVQFAGIDYLSVGDVLAEIESRAGLTVSPREDVEVGCLGATRLTVTPNDTSPETPQFFPVVDIAAGTLSVASGRRLQIDAVTFHMGAALIMVGGSIAKWDETLAAAQPVLDSLTFGPSAGAPC